MSFHNCKEPVDGVQTLECHCDDIVQCVESEEVAVCCCVPDVESSCLGIWSGDPLSSDVYAAWSDPCDREDSRICIDSAVDYESAYCVARDDCCDREDPCSCITSGEVAKWNGVHDLVSANSAAWGGLYDDSWKNSAGLWESASEAVQEHSAYWDSAWSIASGYDPNALDPIYQILSGASAFLESYRDLEKIQTAEWIKGDGTARNPIRLTTDGADRLRDISELITRLYNGRKIDDANRVWLSKSDLHEFEEWLKALDDLMFVVDPTMIDYKSIVGGMDPRVASAASFDLPESGGGIFIQLNKIWAVLRGIERWVVDTTSATVERWNESADRWNWTWDAVDSSADSWNKTASSADFWNSASTIVSDHQEQWNAAYSVVKENSAYWTSGSNVTLKYVPDMNASNASLYAEPNVIYFNDN